MHSSVGVLTARGGMTSHAAVVARGMGKPCVVGCSELTINYELQQAEARGQVINADDTVTIDGASGEVMIGEVATVQAGGSAQFDELMGWVDEIRRLKVRTNADTRPTPRRRASFGAEGIGLCRTEHMFFESARITAMREMIMAESETGRRAAPGQVGARCSGPTSRGSSGPWTVLPVTIRLLDPPLHEFLPHGEFGDGSVGRGAVSRSGGPQSEGGSSCGRVNPMLGLRGCRLGLKFPEIYEMQTRAILEAAVNVERDRRACPARNHGARSSRPGRSFCQGRASSSRRRPNRVFEEQQRRVEYQVGNNDRDSREPRSPRMRLAGDRPTSSRSVLTTSPR